MYWQHPAWHWGSIALARSWKGRLDNVQVTFRMCKGEGCGSKPNVEHFFMLRHTGCAYIDIPEFWRERVRIRKKVPTEECVLGCLADSYAGAPRSRAAAFWIS